MDKTGTRDKHFLKADEAAKQRFWLRVNKTATCWLMKTTNNRGYGQFGYQWLMAPAHRIAKLWAEGKPMPGFFACHICENKHCVRPSHTYWGTPADNSRDEIVSGRTIERAKRYTGQKHWKATLQDIEVAAIWTKYNGRPDCVKNLAAEYKTTCQVIRMILAGLSWRHVTAALPDRTRPEKDTVRYHGANVHSSKLTEEAVQMVRKMRSQGCKLRELAAKFNVTEANISSICRRKTWVHI